MREHEYLPREKKGEREREFRLPFSLFLPIYLDFSFPEKVVGKGSPGT